MKPQFLSALIISLSIWYRNSALHWKERKRDGWRAVEKQKFPPFHPSSSMTFIGIRMSDHAFNAMLEDQCRAALPKAAEHVLSLFIQVTELQVFYSQRSYDLCKRTLKLYQHWKHPEQAFVHTSGKGRHTCLGCSASRHCWSSSLLETWQELEQYQ